MEDKPLRSLLKSEKLPCPVTGTLPVITVGLIIETFIHGQEEVG
jgi:hypothetical protein